MGNETALRIAQWIGIELESEQLIQLEVFSEWLQSEAIEAGGLGPREAERVWERHIADSLAFGYGWKDRNPPNRLLDVGAGVGLPGIPLAIAWPDTTVVLLDRSQRRMDLAARAVRVIDLPNVVMRRGDLADLNEKWEAAVFRAVLPIEGAVQQAHKVTSANGTAVIGIRGASDPDLVCQVEAMGRSAEVVAIPPKMLDHAASLLIMGICGE